MTLLILKKIFDLAKRYWKQLLLGAALLGAFLYGKGCRVKTSPSGVPEVQSRTALGPHQVKRVDINTVTNSVRVTTPKGTEELAGVRHATIVETDKGEVNVTAPTYGLTLEPGLTLFGSSVGGRVGADLNFAYWHNFDALVGFGISPDRLHLGTAYVALGYTPPIQLLSNTDLFVGYSTDRAVVIGVRVAL